MLSDPPPQALRENAVEEKAVRRAAKFVHDGLVSRCLMVGGSLVSRCLMGCFYSHFYFSLVISIVLGPFFETVKEATIFFLSNPSVVLEKASPRQGSNPQYWYQNRQYPQPADPGPGFRFMAQRTNAQKER